MKHEIKIPAGCNVKFSIENGMAITEIEGCETIKSVENQVDEPKFKENDIITCEKNGNKWIAIYKDEVDKDSFRLKAIYVPHVNELSKKENNWACYGDSSRLSTDEEKQLLFEKLKEKCLMFDGQNVVRWRAKMDGAYYFLIDTNRIDWEIDRIGSASSVRYKTGNYFPTKEMAEAFQKVYIESLNNFHKNL